MKPNVPFVVHATHLGNEKATAAAADWLRGMGSPSSQPLEDWPDGGCDREGTHATALSREQDLTPFTRESSRFSKRRGSGPLSFVSSVSFFSFFGVSDGFLKMTPRAAATMTFLTRTTQRERPRPAVQTSTKLDPKFPEDLPCY